LWSGSQPSFAPLAYFLCLSEPSFFLASFSCVQLWALSRSSAPWVTPGLSIDHVSFRFIPPVPSLCRFSLFQLLDTLKPFLLRRSLIGASVFALFMNQRPVFGCSGCNGVFPGRFPFFAIVVKTFGKVHRLFFYIFLLPLIFFRPSFTLALGQAFCRSA